MRQQDFKMVQGVNQIVQMNPSAGIQAGNALSRLGEQIASTGQDVSKIMETTAQAEEETKILRMEQDWDAAFQKQQEFQRDNPNDPLAWQENLDASLAEVEAKNQEYTFYTPAGKQASQMKYQNWVHNSKTSVGRASHTKVLNNRLEVAFVGIDKNLNNGNFGGARELLANSEKWMSPAIQHREMEKIEAAEYQQVLDDNKEAVMFSPVEELEKVKAGKGMYGLIKKEDKESFIGWTESQINKRAKEQGDYLLKIENSEGGMTEAVFKKLQEDGKVDAISEGNQAKYLKGITRTEPPTTDEIMALSDSLQSLEDLQHSNASQREIVETWNDLQIEVAATIPAGSNPWIRQRLNSLDPSYRAKGEDAFLKGNRAKAMSNMSATLSDMKSAGKFRDPNLKLDPLTGKLPVDPREGQEIRMLEKEYEDWLMSMPEGVTLEDANKKIDELVGKANARAKVHTVSDTGQVLRKGKVVSLRNQHAGRGRVSGATNRNGGTWKTVSTVPKSEGAANVRYNNPSAAYPRKRDEKYGVLGYGVLNDGEGNKIAHFPTPVHGAAANFDLFALDYKGMTFRRAVDKWRGRGNTPVPRGYNPKEQITKEFLNNPEKAIDFFKKMSLHESPNFSMSDAEWKQAYQLWKDVNAS